jgi:hypothetical protein
MLAAAALIGACSCPGPNPPPPPPGSCQSRCLGCCNENGLCESGALSPACGASGRACVACPDSRPCIAGACELPYDGGVVACEDGGTCGEGRADVCGSDGCHCGKNSECTLGSVCVNGRCECSPASCTAGCCASGECVLVATRDARRCGIGGAACVDCTADGGDTCSLTGECGCGTGGMCDPTQTCTGTAGCQCDGARCNGCCGDSCIPVGEQTVLACGMSGKCQPCAPWGDRCVDGSCGCGDAGQCNYGLACVNGQCICTHDSCTGGCCSGNTCVGSSGQGQSVCGADGELCIACPPGVDCLLSIGCNCKGRIVCGVIGTATGADHSCALTQDREVLCWGDDAMGQVGLGTMGSADVMSPAFVPGITVVTAIGAGDAYTCAQSQFSLTCWGDTPQGSYVTPHLITPLPNVASFTTGGAHTCVVIDQSGAALCFGDNSSGQLAPESGDAGMYPLPVPVAGLSSGVKQLAAGKSHTCALLLDGGVDCWGKLDANGTSPLDAVSPRHVANLGPATRIACADGLVCAAWPGHAGCIDKTGVLTAFPLDAVDVSAGSGFACAVQSDAGVVCWGDNAHGQLGAPDAGSASFLPVAVQGLDAGALSISCGRAHACAVGSDHQVWCWGEGAHFKLGSGSTSDQPLPWHVAD